MAGKDKLSQENREEMEKGQASSKDHLRPETDDEFEKKFKVLLETENLLFQQLEKHEAVSDKGMRKLQEDIQKYLQNGKKLETLLLGALKAQKFDEKLLKLSEEQKALRKRIIARKQQMGALEIAHLKDLIKAMKDIAIEDDVKDMKLICEMTEHLREAEAALESRKLESKN